MTSNTLERDFIHEQQDAQREARGRTVDKATEAGMKNRVASFPSQPNEKGFWGEYGGRFVPETLIAPLDEVTEGFAEAQRDPQFRAELDTLLKTYAGRETPLYHAARLTEFAGGARIYLKREDLAHTGSHKINNALGQGLLAKRLGKKRVLAETGAGQHGVATATVCALLGLDCTVYMGATDVKRQALNVFRMRLLGAEVREVETGTRTLKDAINEALREWVTDARDSYYLLGSALGPHPYPLMVREFQSHIGREAREQFLEREDKLPDALVACVGGGSNAIGLFHPFLADESVRLVGVEAGGRGAELGEHAARFHTAGGGRSGVLHGAMSYVLQDAHGQIATTHSISAGLDYPSVGPEHAFLRDAKRAEYVCATDEDALAAFKLLARLEGIIPALESAHAVAHAVKLAKTMREDQAIIVNLSGRGDKDVQTVAELVSEQSESSYEPAEEKATSATKSASSQMRSRTQHQRTERNETGSKRRITAMSSSFEQREQACRELW